jgi:hypothetical protein
MEYLEKDTDNPIMWKLKKIVAHQGLLNSMHPDYKGLLYNVQIEWENGEITDEPLAVIAADDPVSCAAYGLEHSLLDQPGWQ